MYTEFLIGNSMKRFVDKNKLICKNTFIWSPNWAKKK